MSKTSMLLLMLFLLTPSLTLSQGRRPGSQNQRPVRKLSLDEQARQEAEKYWHTVLTLCGDSYFTKSYADPKQANQFGVPSEIKGYSILQMKGISIVTEGQAVEPQKLSEADILNGAKPSKPGEGFQWFGKSTLWARVGRRGRHEEIDTPEERLSWNKWSDQGNYLLVNVEKKDGKWSFSSTIGAGYTRFFVPITCDLIEESARIESAPYFDKEGYLRFLATHAGWFSLGRGSLMIRTAPDTAGLIAIERDERLGIPVWGKEGTRGHNDFLAPGLPIGALVFKVGVNGEPEVLFDLYHPDRTIDTMEEVFIGINDSDYSDNKGEFKLRIKRNGSGSDSPGTRGFGSVSTARDNGDVSGLEGTIWDFQSPGYKALPYQFLASGKCIPLAAPTQSCTWKTDGSRITIKEHGGDGIIEGTIMGDRIEGYSYIADHPNEKYPLSATKRVSNR